MRLFQKLFSTKKINKNQLKSRDTRYESYTTFVRHEVVNVVHEIHQILITYINATFTVRFYKRKYSIVGYRVPSFSLLSDSSINRRL